MTQRLGILGCPTKKFQLGGRVNFSKGSACILKGKQKLENIILKGGSNKKELNLARSILRAGNAFKDIASLRGTLGPAALAFTAATEAGLVGYDMLSKGQTFREAVGDSLFNYALGDKTKIDTSEERYKRYESLGYDPDRIRFFEKSLDRIDEIGSQYDELRKKATALGGPKLSEPVLKKQFDIAEKARQEFPAFTQDLFRTGEAQRLQGLDYATEMDYLQKAKRDAEAQQLQSMGPKILGEIFPPKEESRIERLAELGYQSPRPSDIQLADGGLIGDKSGRPPESGPMSQGLPGILKRAMKIKE